VEKYWTDDIAYKDGYESQEKAYAELGTAINGQLEYMAPDTLGDLHEVPTHVSISSQKGPGNSQYLCSSPLG
jgi:hypothetical protein